MNTDNCVFIFFKASAALFTTVMGILFSTDDNKGEDRPLTNGSDLFGEQNFRTGNLDSGADPDGWYEEDL